MKVACLALLAALSTGCVFVSPHIQAPDPAVLDAPHGIGRGREVLVNLPFLDRRYEPLRCGTQKNGYDGETADVVCDQSPTSFLPVLLHDALVKAGFRVIGPESQPGPTTVVVTGVLGQYFVEPMYGMWTVEHEADVAVRLVVTSPSGLHAERLFYAKGEDEALMATENHFQAATDQAVRRIVRNMVVSIADLMDHYPGLGAPSATQKKNPS